MKLLLDNRPVHGHLTANHSASSYGQQVLVLGDGSALGPGDILLDQVMEMSEEELRWVLGSFPALRPIAR